MILPLAENFSIAALMAHAIATPAMAIRLCPHACPMPGNASISELMPIVRPPSPYVYVANQAVGRWW